MKRSTGSHMVVAEECATFLEEHGLKEFADFMNYQAGTMVSRKRGRNVIRLDLSGRSFYLKRNIFHWGECLKFLSRLRLPPRNALMEWRSISAVSDMGIPTVPRVAMGARYRLGIEMDSFVLTEELYGARSLEDVIRRELSGKPSVLERSRKRRLIARVAQIARQLHARCMYHQDLYLGHFYLGPDETLYLIDLQRVIHRPRISRRYLVKDMAQFNYSADCTGGISRADRLRFFLQYRNATSLTPDDKRLIRSVVEKTHKIGRHTVKLLARRRLRNEIP